MTLTLVLTFAFTSAVPAGAVAGPAEGPVTSALQTLQDVAFQVFELVAAHLPQLDPGSHQGSGGNPHDDDGSGREGESPHMDPDGVAAHSF